jgi:CelD/BcsL family acetyltransferase involved in cellulose biosynthesis
MLTSAVQIAAERTVVAVESIRDLPAFLALKDEWDELQQRSDAHSLFLSWEWLYTWWKSLADNRALSILTARCHGELIGVAPLCRRPASLHRRDLFPVVEFLGSGEAGCDYLDVLVRRGWEPEALDAFASNLRQARPVLRWSNVAWNDSRAARLAELLGKEKWIVEEAATNRCPYIPLLGKSWEDYLGSLGSEHRYNFHRKLRRLNREYLMTFEQATTESECRESIDLTMELHRKRWRGRGDSEAFHTPASAAFHRSFAQIALKRGWLRLYILRLSGRPAACLYGFLHHRKFYFYQSGMDPAFEKYSVGMIGMGLAIQRAIEEGAAEYDLLHGEEAYKFHWASESREIGRFELYPPGMKGRLAQSAVELDRASRRLARRVLSKFP